MPITQEWDNPDKTIYRLEINGQFTWAEFDAAIEQSNHTMASRAPTRVDIIMCVNAPLPPGNAMPHMRYAGGNQAKNTTVLLL
jgi:hypothetical protein